MSKNTLDLFSIVCNQEKTNISVIAIPIAYEGIIKKIK